MSSVEGTDYVRQVVTTTKIIVGSLMMGVATFVVILLTVLAKAPPAANQQPVESPVPSLVVAPVALGAVVLAWLIPRYIASKARKDLLSGAWKGQPAGGDGSFMVSPGDEAGFLAGRHQISTILQCAVLEGTAFLAGVIYFIGGDAWLVGVMGLMMVMIGTRFPSLARVRRWIENQRAIVEEERQFGSV